MNNYSNSQSLTSSQHQEDNIKQKEPLIFKSDVILEQNRLEQQKGEQKTAAKYKNFRDSMGQKPKSQCTITLASPKKRGSIVTYNTVVTEQIKKKAQKLLFKKSAKLKQTTENSKLDLVISNENQTSQQNSLHSPIALNSPKKRGSIHAHTEILKDFSSYQKDVLIADQVEQQLDQVEDQKVKTESPTNEQEQDKQLSKKPTKKKHITNYALGSKPGALPDVPVKINQDSLLLHFLFNQQENQNFFAVLDGHGVEGHHVSQFIQRNISKYIEYYAKKYENNIMKAIFKGFNKTDELLLQATYINSKTSGTTIVGVLLQENKLYCCNLGDSRAILGNFTNNV